MAAASVVAASAICEMFWGYFSGGRSRRLGRAGQAAADFHELLGAMRELIH